MEIPEEAAMLSLYPSTWCFTGPLSISFRSSDPKLLVKSDVETIPLGVQGLQSSASYFKITFCILRVSTGEDHWEQSCHNNNAIIN